jgi:hypothetical protein
MKTYFILDHGRAIQCLVCTRISYHPTDVAQRYCGFCHRYHWEELPEEQKAS